MTGLERIQEAFRGGRKAFMPYMVLGYPEPEASLRVIETLVRAGADLLELGVPFSDPLADGPAIQAATQQALRSGVSVGDCLQMVARLRGRGIDTPALLMGYLNPFMSYGIDRCTAHAREAGADGFIVPDLPPEEAGEFEAACGAQGLALVHLVAPTSSPERIALIVERSQGFIYVAAVTGVTGERATIGDELPSFVARVRATTRGGGPAAKPIALGFGIGSGAQASAVAQMADGVIVGSALVRAAGRSLEDVDRLAREIRAALGGTEG